MRIRAVRLRPGEVPALVFTRAFASRCGIGLAVVAGLTIAFRWAFDLVGGSGTGWALAGLAVLWSCSAVEEAFDHAAARRPVPAPQAPTRAPVRLGPDDGGPDAGGPDDGGPGASGPGAGGSGGPADPLSGLALHLTQVNSLPWMGLGIALLALGAGHREAAAATALGAGTAVLVQSVGFVRRCRAQLPGAPRTAVRVVGFTDPICRGLVLQPLDGQHALVVPDAWRWREDLVVGDVLTWYGPLPDPGGRPRWRPPARALRCPGRTHAVRHADSGDGAGPSPGAEVHS